MVATPDVSRDPLGEVCDGAQLAALGVAVDAATFGAWGVAGVGGAWAKASAGISVAIAQTVARSGVLCRRILNKGVIIT